MRYVVKDGCACYVLLAYGISVDLHLCDAPKSGSLKEMFATRLVGWNVCGVFRCGP